MDLTNNAGSVSSITGSNGSQATVRGGGSMVMTAGAGSEILNATAATGNVTLVGGGGNVVMAGGAGSDTFEFVHGQGAHNATIVNFTTADTLELSGYGGANSVAGEQVTGGNLILTLSDSSKIVFAGLPILNPTQVQFS